jgi:hypothetical protein
MGLHRLDHRVHPGLAFPKVDRVSPLAALSADSAARAPSTTMLGPDWWAEECAGSG